MDDVPPPPYSVCDPHAPGPAQTSRQPLFITAFNALVDAPATALPVTSAGRPEANLPAIFSPQRSVFPISSPSADIQAETSISQELQRAGFVSAAPYFELRPPSELATQPKLYHHFSIVPDACPDNLPFPQPAEKWIYRGMDGQDWLTFLNHLFPPHRSEKYAAGVGQELEADAELNIGRLNLSNSWSRDQSRPLLQGRLGPSNGGMNTENERLRRLRIEAVISQWNEGFFGPRGLEVLPDIGVLAAPAVETITRRSSGNVLQKRPPPHIEESLLHQACAKGKKSQVRELLGRGNEDVEALNKNGQTALFVAVSRGDKDIVQLLLEHGADPTARPPDSDSNIHSAVYNDRKTILKHLLSSSRVGLDERNSKDETPLWVAVHRHHNSCIETLLDAGANPNARPVGKDSMLHMAVTGDQKSIVKLLLERGVDLEEWNGAGESPLFRAVSRGSTSIVKLLLDHGASTVTRTSKGMAPLAEAVGRGDKSIVLLLLAQKDIDVEVENEKFQRPLYKAISRGDSSIAEQLLRKGADPNKCPPGEETPLNLNLGRGSTSLTYLLLEHGADVEDKNRSGESPLFAAVSQGNSSLVSILLSKGANPNTTNPAGESALQRAVTQSNVSIASLLLSRGANPELGTRGGSSPLYQAVANDQIPMVSILLGHKANPNLRSSNGELPLERAIYASSIPNVSLLLGGGADLNAKTANGETVMDYAAKRGDKTILLLLKNHWQVKSPGRDPL